MMVQEGKHQINPDTQSNGTNSKKENNMGRRRCNNSTSEAAAKSLFFLLFTFAGLNALLSGLTEEEPNGALLLLLLPSIEYGTNGRRCNDVTDEIRRPTREIDAPDTFHRLF